MRTRITSIVTSIMLTFLLGILSLPAVAQHGEHGDNILIGKKGEVTFNSAVRAGAVSLSAGRYQVQHVVEGLDHFIVFNKIVSGSAYHTGVSGKDAARVKCRTEPLTEKAKYDEIRLGVNSAGEKTVEEILIKGENVKHLF